MSAVRSRTSRVSLSAPTILYSTPGGVLISAASSTLDCASSWRRMAICCARSSSARRNVAVCTGGSSLPFSMTRVFSIACSISASSMSVAGSRRCAASARYQAIRTSCIRVCTALRRRSSVISFWSESCRARK